MQKGKKKKSKAIRIVKKTGVAKSKFSEKIKLPDFKKTIGERRRLRLDRILMAAGVIALILIIFFSYSKLRKVNFGEDVVALVDNQKITKAQLDKEYEFFFFVRNIPQEYKSVVTKEVILNQTIDEILLIEEAKKKGYSVSEQEINEVMERVVNLSGMSLEDISKTFEQNNFTLQDLKNFYWKVLLVNKLLNETVNSKVNVTEEEMRKFYEENNLTIKFDDIKERIKEQILVEKRYEEYQRYVGDLKKNARIEILYNRIS